MPQPPPLRDDEVVYIAIRNPNFMDATTRKIKPNAFYMRPADFEGDPPYGLSTTVLDHCPTIEEIMGLTGLKSKVCGVDFLSVGAIRAMGLRVVRIKETKALIEGMPYPINDEDYVTAGERNILAQKLVALSQRGVR